MERLHAEGLLVSALRARSRARLHELRRLLGPSLSLDFSGALPTLRISDRVAVGIQPRDGKMVLLGAADMPAIGGESAEAMLAIVRIAKRRTALRQASFAVGAIPKSSPNFAQPKPPTTDPPASASPIASGSLTPQAPPTTVPTPPPPPTPPQVPTTPQAISSPAAPPPAEASAPSASSAPAYAELTSVGGPEWQPIELLTQTQRQKAELPIPLPQRTVRVPVARSAADGASVEGSIEMELVAVRAQALKLGTVAAFEHQLASAGLSAEVASDHTLHLAPLPASACCPPLPEALLGDQLGATVKLLKPPLPMGCAFGGDCPSGALLSFDDTGGHFTSRCLTPTSLRRLLLDLQSLAMVRAMLSRLEEFRAAGAPGMARLRLLRASAAGLLLLTESGRVVSLTCGGDEAAHCLSLEDLAATPPLLQMRMLVDGATPPGAVQAELAMLVRTASVFDLLSCDALASMGVLG
ncbi:MAG: hypothetical protein SGPRY_007989 [Prymnesium sp.]